MDSANYVKTRMEEFIHIDENLIAVGFMGKLYREHVLKKSSTEEDYEPFFNIVCKCTKGKCDTEMCNNFKNLMLCPPECGNNQCCNKGKGSFNQIKQLEVFQHLRHGAGVRATRPIPKDKMVFQFIGNVTSIEDYESQNFDNNRFQYGMNVENVVIDPTRFGNIARFVNSSCSSNLYSTVEVMDSIPRMFFHAAREIREGEEITYKYRGNILKECTCETCLSKKEPNPSGANTRRPPHQEVRPCKVKMGKRVVLKPKRRVLVPVPVAQIPNEVQGPNTAQSSTGTVTPPPTEANENLEPGLNGRYTCSICEKQFKRSDNVQRHIKTHHNHVMYKCDHCGKEYARLDVLNKHCKQKHGKPGREASEKIVWCMFCQQGFTTAPNLARHIISVHQIL